MPLSGPERSSVETFRLRCERQLAGRGRIGQPARDDRPDESVLATRFPLADRIWLELTVRPFVPQVRAGIVTDDRWKNEELEERIEESGDTMSEFVEMGFEEAGLEWIGPPVEHYRDQGRYFCFATGLELRSLADLAEEATFDRLARMLDGYYRAFLPGIERMEKVAGS